MHIALQPIGVIHSRFNDPNTGARQAAIDGCKGRIVVHKAFTVGLEGLEHFSHIIALYYFHRQTEILLRAKPCFDPITEHGIFASRYPARPNHIGMSVLTLDHIQDNVLHCRDIDVLDGTPLLDIKPYVKHFDRKRETKCGWYDQIDWTNPTARPPSRA